MTALLGLAKSALLEKYQGIANNRIFAAVETAARRTGADFAYLMDKASAESNFDPAARAKSSSATGLYQFIEKTWLQMVADTGHKYGLEKYADQIAVGGDGRLSVADPKVKQEILDLRKNPEISALMAGEFAQANKDYLETHGAGGEIGSTELYLAHFLGAGSAAKFLNGMAYDPKSSAATLFPKAAAANKNVFFGKDGAPKTLQQIYDAFDKKFASKNDAPNDVRVAAQVLPTPAFVSTPTSQEIARTLSSFIGATENGYDTPFLPAAQRLSSATMFSLLDLLHDLPEDGKNRENT